MRRVDSGVGGTFRASGGGTGSRRGETGEPKIRITSGVQLVVRNAPCTVRGTGAYTSKLPPPFRCAATSVTVIIRAIT